MKNNLWKPKVIYFSSTTHQTLSRQDYMQDLPKTNCCYWQKCILATALAAVGLKYAVILN